MIKPWRDVTSLYQIYPRSFRDTNNDGVGDLKGITSRLDYIAWLGVDAIWISPFFTSPMTDFGYDISNYRDVDPTFGTLNDFRELLQEAHQLGIRVMIDLVPCHTSNQHPWFIESRSSRDNPKRDWYTWRDGSEGAPPNNWRSLAGGSSWTFDETTNQYYLHSFLPTQPDLNWDNPQVREAIKDVARFWFDMGVDGMRVDAIWGISKDPELRDDALNELYNGPEDGYGAFRHNRCKNGPHMQAYLAELASVCDEYDDRHMVFEFYPDEQLGDIYEQYHAVANAHPRASAFFMEHRQDEWHADNTGQHITHYLSATHASLPFFCTGNHDQPRIASRLGAKRSRALQFLNLTCPGVSVIYYGEEIGMENGQLSTHDIKNIFIPDHTPHDSRDRARTPMQWTNTRHAGFSAKTPWLPVHANYPAVNVISELRQKSSLLHFHHDMLQLRREMPVLVRGTFEVITNDNGYVLTIKRSLDEQDVYILVNVADQAQSVELPENAHVIISTPNDIVSITDKIITLPGYSAALLQARQ